ncbi:hypothetical protein ISTM_194 [Insectomime virus]|uniref:Uncharacterized protein n=1 Tax=Tunisvirus fontaine2 TaxID=1421067 RepID=V9SD78_9VIRU|nr:hypothetical protein D1R32_gp126 [Tunisvirus fontaine2]AHA46092.1 hypothetical protein ISTM_194 [Insectomime virus]AHC54843.1 hypothetical protein TNS_ORF125 [Tunisvirus fontaine2]
MEEVDQVIIRLLSENDQKNEQIRELEQTTKDMREQYQKALDENTVLRDRNFELLSRLLETEQKILESADNVSIL